MFGERCLRCGISADKVRLFDVIYEGRAGLLCERCTIIENISIIKKPDEEQIKNAEKGYTVYDRMKKLSEMNERKKISSSLKIERLRELDENPYLQFPVRKSAELIEYFHWILMRSRRRLGLTQERLSEKTGIPIEDIENLERGEIIDNVDSINKLENFLGINLRRKSLFKEEREAKPILLDEYGNELDHIPEPEFSGDEYTDQLIKEESINDFEIDKADLSKVNLNDLRELHRKRIEASKEEQREEQRKIEEKQKLIEARKEELRILKEKESNYLDTMLGGNELLKDETKIKEINTSENKVDRLFDAFED